jgi:cell division protein FtsA
VVTGGGAHLEGVTELAGQVFGKPARMGLPTRISGVGEAWQRPEYTAAVGLVLWGQDRRPPPVQKSAESGGDPGPVRRPVSRSPGEGTLTKVWDFIKKNFI